MDRANLKHINHLMVCDAHAIPLEKGTLGAVMSWNVFHYIQDLPLALSEVSRVLRRDGLFILGINASGKARNRFSLKFLRLLGFAQWAQRLEEKIRERFNQKYSLKNLLTASEWDRVLYEKGFQEVSIHALLGTSGLSCAFNALHDLRNLSSELLNFIPAAATALSKPLLEKADVTSAPLSQDSDSPFENSIYFMIIARKTDSASGCSERSRPAKA